AIPTVLLVGFEECGRRLVEAVVEDAKLLGLPTDLPVLVVQDEERDPYSERRTRSILTALERAGRPHERLTVASDKLKAKAQLAERLQTLGHASMILSEGDYGLFAGVQAQRERIQLGLPEFDHAGYASYDVGVDPEVLTRVSGFANRDIDGYTT